MSTDNIAHRDAIIGIVLRGWRNRAQSDLGALSFFFESFKRVIADFRLNDSANCFGVIFIELNTRLNPDLHVRRLGIPGDPDPDLLVLR